MKKRILRFLLAILCLAGIGVGHQAFAAEVIAGEEYNSFYNVSWKLTDDGVMTVSSQRTIHGGKDGSVFPWYQYREKITKIVIESPTQWIGEHVFSGLENVEEVVLPKSLKTIYTGAFSGCSKLKSVEIPDSVEQIGEGAFAGCTSLERIKLPANSNYTTVPEPSEPVQQPSEQNGAPWYLLVAGAVVIAVMAALLVVKKRAVVCLLVVLLVAAPWTVAVAAQQSGVQWEYDAATGTATATGKGTLTRQGFYDQFGDQPLRHLIIGEGILEIGSAGFMQCMELESVEFPESLQVIGRGAFEQCYNLKSLEFPDGLLLLDVRAFYACVNVSQITFGSKLRSIGAECFSAIQQVEQVQLPDSLLYIGSGAFLNCIALQRISLGTELSYLGAGAFTGCGSLQSIHVSRENRYFSDLDGVLLTADGKTLLCYPNGRGEEYTIPACVTKIAAEAFIYCEGLKTIHIPGTVESIGERAFADCYAMTCVDMAEGILEIGNYAFSQCLGLQTLTIPASVKQMNASVIEYSELRQLVFLGEKPEQLDPWFYMYDLAVYYPVGDSSWDAIRKEHFDHVRWIPLCTGEHTPQVLPGKAENCLEKGMTDGISCSECGLLIKTQEALPLGDHDFSQWELVKSPTETETGIEERVCSCCGEKEERSVEKLSPPPPVEEKTDMWLIVVLVLVEVCFIGVEIYLLLRKKKMKVK